MEKTNQLPYKLYKYTLKSVIIIIVKKILKILSISFKLKYIIKSINILY